MAIIVNYNKIRDLDEGEKQILVKIIEKETPKLERLIKDPSNLIVNIKVTKKETRRRYELHLKLETTSKRRFFDEKSKEVFLFNTYWSYYWSYPIHYS